MLAQPVFCRPLIERRAELELLHERRRGASAGRGGLVLFAGEAGIGKTRLISEFTRSLAVPRLRVVLAHCREFANRPYAPVLDLLAQLDARADSLAPARSRDEHFEPLIRAFARESERSTIVAVVEDVHWSDPATAELIAAIAESAGRRRLLLVATYRPEAIREDSAMFASLARLRRLPVTTTAELRALDADATRRFVEATLEPTGGLPAHIRASIVRLSDGNPLFVEELLKSALETSGDGAAPGLPATIRAAILERLRPLAAEEREIVAHAAVVGRRFTTALLETIVRVPHDRMLAALHHACTLQLVTEEGPGAFAFRHALTRETIYNSFLRTQRAAFHDAIARALEAMPNDQRSVQDLAYHTWAAGDRAAAARYGERAGDEAHAVFAHDDAARYYEAALASVEPRSIDAARIALKLGRTHNHNLDKRQCGAYYEQAAEAFAAADDIDGESDARFEQTAALYSLDAPDCTRPLERLRERLTQPRHAALRTRADVRLAHLYQLLGRGDECGALLAAIAPRDLANGDRRVRATYHATRAALAAQSADVDACRIAFGESLAAAGDDFFTRHVILSNAAGTFTDLGRFDEAMRYFDETEALARTHHLKSSEAFVLATKARFWWLRGELAQARECVHRALAIPSEYELARLELICCAPLIGELMDDDALIDGFDLEALPSKHLGRLAASAALKLVRCGRVADAQGLLRRALDDPADARTPFVLHLAIARIGTPAHSTAARAVVARLAALDGDVMFKAALPLFDALVAVRRGDTRSAREQAHEAVERFRATRAPIWEAEAHELAGKPREAAAVYRRIGAVVPLRRIERDAAHGTRERGAPGPTPREREVLALAGRGLSNGEIARELAITVKAVEKHIGSLYAKLGFTSRGRLVAHVSGRKDRADQA